MFEHKMNEKIVFECERWVAQWMRELIEVFLI